LVEFDQACTRAGTGEKPAKKSRIFSKKDLEKKGFKYEIV